MKNTQPLRRELENVLDRTIGDDTWHRLRKQLLENGIDYPEFPTAFQMLKQLHAGKTGNNYRIVPPTEALLSIWNQHKKVTKRQSKMTCDYFLSRITLEAKTNNEELPKDRYKGKKKIGINTIWYRWFSACGIPFEKGKEYPVSKLICVAYHLKIWQANQSKRLMRTIQQETV